MSEPKPNTVMIVDVGDDIARAVAHAVGACEQAFGISPVVLGEQIAASPTVAALTDAEILADLQGDKCRACGGRKRDGHAFCATDFAALTIFQRRQMSMGLKGEAFYDKYRSALRHLQLNPTRLKQLPSRGGEWSYRSEDDLERAGFKFMEHARCNVPHCYQRIVWYRTPNGGQMPVNLEDYQPHKTSCTDPEYFQRKREERAQTFAQRKQEKKSRNKKRRRA